MRTRDSLSILTVEEQVRVDGQRLHDIVDELGESAAQNVIGLALEHLAQALTDAHAAGQGGDMALLAAQADRLSRLAWQVGLVTLEGVAVDVGDCAGRGDRTALAATLARLMRVGNHSLTLIWDDTPVS
ncbi:MAG TPA: hypothetical protein PLL33_10495 [Paracoccus sp. (in: a-proteobacteria)]|nr:hypothetical protein [Paracoccus sp. (in: a-proteobacteria)]